MNNNNLNTPSSVSMSTPAERKFMDLIQHGDDFCKIELWRPLKSWYTKALELNIEPDTVRQKIAECKKSIAYEVKTIRIIVTIAAVLVLICYIL